MQFRLEVGDEELGFEQELLLLFKLANFEGGRRNMRGWQPCCACGIGTVNFFDCGVDLHIKPSFSENFLLFSHKRNQHLIQAEDSFERATHEAEVVGGLVPREESIGGTVEAAGQRAEQVSDTRGISTAVATLERGRHCELWVGGGRERSEGFIIFDHMFTEK